MPDILTRQVDRGFDASIRDAAELPRGSAADGSQNVLYTRGTVKTPYGFAQVESGSLPLDSGKDVLALDHFFELDKTQHFIAVTEDKIYDRNYVTNIWDDVTQSGQALGSNASNPVSIATILHTDGLALNGTGRSWYHHCLVCNGLTPIQRWAGKFEADFDDLAGADGYHHVSSSNTSHYALQVGSFYNRAILISAKEADAENNLVENNQRIRWPQAGKLESWTGAGSGAVDLLDTGGYNVWGARLGRQWIQYQNTASLTHVGGTRVFEADVEIPELGLLAPHLLYAKNNVHYFVGNDYNLYAYYGGSNIQKMSKGIQRYLKRDLDPTYAKKSWLCMGAENSRLWLFIVPNGKTEVTEAYAIDLNTGAWQKRDYTHKWATGGITSVALIGAGSFTDGMTYAEATATARTYADYSAGGDTELALKTYEEMTETVLTDERLAFGDSAGYIYQYDSELIRDDGVDIPARHITEIYDFGLPSKNKICPGIRVTAKGTGMIVSYRTNYFETNDTGWTDIQAHDSIFDLTSDCIARWKFNDNAANTTVHDSSGNSHNGVASSNSKALRAVGTLYSCFDFGGTDYVAVPDHDDFSFAGDSAFSIVADIYVSAAGVQQTIISKSTSSIAGEWGFSLNLADRLVFLLTHNTAAAYIARFTTAALSVGWHHVIGTYDGTKTFGGINLYVDDVAVAMTDTASGSYVAMEAGSLDVTIGSVSDGSQKFEDKLNNVMIFNKELSAAEASSLSSFGVRTESLKSTVKTLTNDFTDYEFFIHDTAKRVQFKFSNADGDDFQISSYEVIEPMVLGAV